MHCPATKSSLCSLGRCWRNPPSFSSLLLFLWQALSQFNPGQFLPIARVREDRKISIMRVPDPSVNPRPGTPPITPGSYFFEHGPGAIIADFNSKLPDLFFPESQACKVRVVDIVPAPGNETTGVDYPEKGQVIEHTVSNIEEVTSILNRPSLAGCSRTFIVRRTNSWSRMNITYTMFHALCASTRTSPHFLKLVLGLGRKRSSTDEDFMACYSRFSSSSGKSQEDDGACDICYNIRYYERHGRDLEDPWSCRQSAIHQAYNSISKESGWLVIQPPTAFTSAIKQSGTDGSEMCVPTAGHPMNPHLKYLTASMAGWRGYFNYISARLKGLDGEVAISKRYGEFQVDFSSKQDIHALRCKLHHAATILENSLSTIVTLGSHGDTMAKKANLPLQIHEDFQRELQNLSGELRNYLHTTQKLLKYSDDIRSLYGDILKFHSQELIQYNGMALTKLTEINTTETRAMVSLADRARQESRTMRIATVIAVYYLPANLVLSFFSTTLVWFEDVSTDDQGQGLAVLRVHREVWIAILVTVVLAAFTMAVSSWSERREARGETQEPRPGFVTNSSQTEFKLC
ncbi:hypothetical protein BJX63DRAFT_397920 [Aspergillus granulosus]|uniref:CorA-like transporter domain-containing protein n=1 Tax=Aspergillus granulosus TaxID=176169 RepID=A0ABR4H8Q2_9EURO